MSCRPNKPKRKRTLYFKVFENDIKNVSFQFLIFKYVWWPKNDKSYQKDQNNNQKDQDDQKDQNNQTNRSKWTKSAIKLDLKVVFGAKIQMVIFSHIDLFDHFDLFGHFDLLIWSFLIIMFELFWSLW